MLSIVMYHYVREIENSEYPGIKGLELEKFRKQIDFFTKNHHVVRMEDVLADVLGERKLPENAMLLTFDDGYLDHYKNVYPILKENKIQGSFFMASKVLQKDQALDTNKIHYILASRDTEDIIPVLNDKLDILRQEGYQIEDNETLMKTLGHANRWDSAETIFIKRLLQTYLPEQLRNRVTGEMFDEIVGIPESQFVKKIYLTMNQIQEMKDGGMFFGLHSRDHSWLNQIPLEQAKEEIQSCKQFFSNVIDPNCWVMNFPFGGYSDELIDYIKGEGCALGLSVEARMATLAQKELYTLPRFDTNDFPPVSERYKELSN